MRKIIAWLFILQITFTDSYAQSGQLDPSFGRNGKVIISTVTNNRANLNEGIAIQPDGKIILAGSSINLTVNRGYDMLVVRIHPNGNLDASFGNHGAVVIDYQPDTDPSYDDYAKDVAVTPEGKIVVVGRSERFNSGIVESDIIIVQLNADGSRDATFDGDGMKPYSFGSGFESAEAVAILPTGYILVACHTVNSGERKSDIMLLQFKPDGQLDEFFGAGGFTGISLGESEYVYDMFLQPDGTIVVGGEINYTESGERDFAVARFDPRGHHDHSFSDDGILTFDMGSKSERVNSIAAQSDGKIVVTGRYVPMAEENETGIPVARINEDGTLDSSFDEDGKKVIQLPGFGEGYSILVDSQDHILVGGNTQRNTSGPQNFDFVLIKLTPEGNPDTRFDDDGKVYVDFTRPDLPPSIPVRNQDLLRSMIFQSDGKIVLGGMTSYGSFSESDLSYAVARMLYVADVGPSNVLATYIGPKTLGTPCYGCQTAIIPLRATIQDQSPYLGDIRNARVKFVDRDNNVDITEWIPVSKLIDPNDTKTATVDATWYVTLSYHQPVKKVRVGMVVDNGDYLRNESRDDATIILYMPQEDMVSGGGELFASGTSKGKYKSDPGSRTLFGFFAQMKPGMPHPSGRMDMWFSGANQGGNSAVYHLEIASINGLGVDIAQSTSKQAEFHGSGQLWDRSGVTPVLVEDNVTVQTHLIDNGDPGFYDLLTVYIWSNNNVLLHSSNWVYSQARPQLLFNGSIIVHSGSSLDESSSELMTKSLIRNEKEKIGQKELDVSVFNNPTPNHFTLKVSSTHSNVYSVRIMDISGRVVDARSNLPVENILQIGDNYKRGIYFAEIRQGRRVRIIKLVKY